MYLLVKLLYLANVFLQLYLMSVFLGSDHYSRFGTDVIQQMFDSGSWEQSGFFPRVTLCDFKVRVMGSNVQRYSIQCVLVINIFNEKIFIFLWFWLAILAVLTSLSIIYWTIIMLFPPFSRWFISRHLELSELPFDPHGNRKDVERFVVGYLKTDGVFILRMITLHAGIIYGTDLVLNLWKTFYGIEAIVKRKSLEDAAANAAIASAPPPETGFHLFSALRNRKHKDKNKNDLQLQQQLLLKSGPGSVRGSSPGGIADKQQFLMKVLIPDGSGGTTPAYILRSDDSDNDTAAPTDKSATPRQLTSAGTRSTELDDKHSRTLINGTNRPNRTEAQSLKHRSRATARLAAGDRAATASSAMPVSVLTAATVAGLQRDQRDDSSSDDNDDNDRGRGDSNPPQEEDMNDLLVMSV